MKALITASGQIGPFTSIARTADDTGWLAGDCIYPDGVIGDATVGDWVTPPPTSPALNAPILTKIEELELAADKPRRRREAILTESGKQWLAANEADIQKLRDKLV